jgi:hypothetical protein
MLIRWCGVTKTPPPATDVLLDFTVPFSGGGTPAYLEIDKLPEGLYRARSFAGQGTSRDC